MSVENQSAYILDGQELVLLLQAKGIACFQGFSFEKIADTEEQMLKVLLGLTEKGFLLSDGKEFFVEQGISECFEILEKAKGLLLIIPGQEESPELFCYPGEEILVCQPAAFKPGAVKLWKTDWENLGDLIAECGWETEIRYYGPGQVQAYRNMWSIRGKEGYRLKKDGEEFFILHKDMGKILKTLTEDVIV